MFDEVFMLPVARLLPVLVFGAMTTLPCAAQNTALPATRRARSLSPARMSCTRQPIVGSTGPPVCGCVYSSAIPSNGLPSLSRSASSASIVCSQE